MADEITHNDELLSIDEAVEELRSSRSTVYRWLKTGALKGVKVGRQWRVHPEELARFASGEGPRVMSTPGVAAFRTELLMLASADEVEVPPEDLVMATVALITQVALGRGATHFALEAHLSDSGRIVGWFRTRADGALSTLAEFEASALPALLEGWKRWGGCDPHCSGEIQNGRAVLAMGEDRQPIDLRITVLPSVLGESVQVSVLDPQRAAEHINLDRLDFDASDRARIDRALAAPSGATIVTGPTGAGKSTFLYACLRELAGADRHTIAIESPVEWRVPGVMHIPVQEDRGVTFPAAMRAAMHCDPDVVMISEIRDQETLELAPAMALVGHVVLTALHAPSAIGALMRMAEFGLERHTIAEATRLVVAQQLVRRLCSCKEAAAPSAVDLARAERVAAESGVALAELWHRPVGCPACGQTGYRGRRVIAETVEITDALRAALLDGADAATLWDVALDDGSTSLVADGIRRAALGETALEEVWRVAGVGGRAN